MRSLVIEHAIPLIRFSLVGVLNTGIYYVAYLLLILSMPYLGAHLLAWCVAVTVSFLLNCRFTYHVQPTWRRYALFPIASLPNILATSLGVVGLVEFLHLDVKIAPLIAGICAVPFSYLLAKLLMLKAHGSALPEGCSASTE